MKIFRFSYSLNPDIADSELVKSVQDQLANHSIENYVKDHYNIDSLKDIGSLKGPAKKSDYVNRTTAYIIKNHDFFNTTDVIRFFRLRDDVFNIFEVKIDRDVRSTPKYFRDMLDVLGKNKDTFIFDEMDVPEANKNIFKDYKLKDAK